ncbi:hypothetical protein [Ureaplasma canigenitalium]|uniref:hypothetical protein n=1 Tax=Ureaplasma canigenitalium TaxID=42092 RepID=UPI0004E24E8F|nr:hypothetical protein [Ureaplasma canigenitalium]
MQINIYDELKGYLHSEKINSKLYEEFYEDDVKTKIEQNILYMNIAIIVFVLCGFALFGGGIYWNVKLIDKETYPSTIMIVLGVFIFLLFVLPLIIYTVKNNNYLKRCRINVEKDIVSFKYLRMISNYSKSLQIINKEIIKNDESVLFKLLYQKESLTLKYTQHSVLLLNEDGKEIKRLNKEQNITLIPRIKMKFFDGISKFLIEDYLDRYGLFLKNLAKEIYDDLYSLMK